MTAIEITLYGVAGGALPELLALYKLRHDKKGTKPDWLKSSFYWVVTFIMVCLGGATAFIYHKVGINVNELMAIHLGAATPLIISSFEKGKPDIS
jgi:hypothetical protein